MFKSRKLVAVFVALFMLLTTTYAKVAQDSTPITETPSLTQQFDNMIKGSTTYQTYRVVSIEKIQKFKKNLSFSLKKSEKEIASLKTEVENRDLTIQELRNSEESVKQELVTLQESKDSMMLFGVQTSKAKYKSIMWTIILALGAISSVLFILFRRTRSVTSSTKQRLSEVQEEFENHRRSALEREQKLARKLHTELHKNR